MLVNPPINGLSSNGRTSGFEPENLGSSPSEPANLKGGKMNWVKVKQHDWDKLAPETKEKPVKDHGYKFIKSRDRVKFEKRLLMEEEARLKRDMV